MQGVTLVLNLLLGVLKGLCMLNRRVFLALSLLLSTVTVFAQTPSKAANGEVMVSFDLLRDGKSLQRGIATIVSAVPQPISNNSEVYLAKLSCENGQRILSSQPIKIGMEAIASVGADKVKINIKYLDAHSRNAEIKASTAPCPNLAPEQLLVLDQTVELPAVYTAGHNVVTLRDGFALRYQITPVIRLSATPH